jgi:hypothetical protein
MSEGYMFARRIPLYETATKDARIVTREVLGLSSDGSEQLRKRRGLY